MKTRHPKHELFIYAIQQKRKMRIIYWSEKDQDYTERTIAPLDFGPIKGKDTRDRYIFWDFTGSKRPHVSSIVVAHVHDMVLLEEGFKPEDIVTWPQILWHVKRHWPELEER